MRIQVILYWHPEYTTPIMIIYDLALCTAYSSDTLELGRLSHNCHSSSVTYWFTSSTLRLKMSSNGHLSPCPCFKSKTSPISSQALSTRSTSSFVCAALRQKRTRPDTRDVAGYATTTTTIGVVRSFIMRWKRGSLPRLKMRRGTIGDEGWPYVMKPSLVSPRWRYRELNARRRRRERPSLPSRKAVGRSIQIGKDAAGAGPGCDDFGDESATVELDGVDILPCG